MTKEMKRLLRIWTEGEEARKLGLPESANPFCPKMREHEAWRRGWNDIDLDFVPPDPAVEFVTPNKSS